MKNSTISVDPHTAAGLKKIAQSEGLNMKEFMKAVEYYFRTTGVRVSDTSKSATQAIEENNKRLSQVISFIRQEEKHYLTPLLDKVTGMTDQVLSAMKERDKQYERIKNDFGYTYNELHELKRLIQQKLR